MIVINGTFRIAPERLAIARPAMQAMVDASRAEPGCLGYAYAEDLFDPGLIRVNEIWESRDALAAHFSSAHLALWRAEWPALGIHSRDLVLYPVASPEPI